MMSRLDKKKSVASKILMGLAALTLLSLIIQAILGVSIAEGVLKYKDYVYLRDELSKAKILWNERGSTRYQIEVRSNKFFGNNEHPCNLAENIEFENGIAVKGYDFDECRNSYDEIAVERLFGVIDKEVSGINIFLTDWSVEFDKQYGYVSFYRIDYRGSVVFPNKNRSGLFQSDYDFKGLSIDSYSEIK